MRCLRNGWLKTNCVRIPPETLVPTKGLSFCIFDSRKRLQQDINSITTVQALVSYSAVYAGVTPSKA